MNPHLLLVASAPLLIVLGVPLWMRRVPPNRFYGVRTAATRSNDAVWYDVNARSGRDLSIAGVLLLFGIFTVERVGSTWVQELRNLAIAGLLILLLAGVSVRATRRRARSAARKLP